MKDTKLITLKLKIVASYEDRVPLVQPKLLQAASAAATDDDATEDGDDDVKEDGDDDDDDELEEGEIREDTEVRDDDQETISEISKMKICPYPYCRREFSNGKALGGHLRIHKEHQSKTKPKIKPKTEPSTDPNPARSEDGYPCSLCGKMFASKKAVFGHMRSHNGRANRGVQDPGSGSGKPGWARWKGTRKRRASEVEAEAEAEGNSSHSSSSHHANGGVEDDMMAVDVGDDDATDGGMRKVNNVLPEQEDDQNANEAEILRIMEKKMKEFDEDELYFLQGYFEQLTTKLNSSNPPTYNKPPTFPSLNSNSEQVTTKPNLNNPPNYDKPPNFSSLNSNSEASTSHSSKKQVAVKKKKRRFSVHHHDKDQEESPWKCITCNKTFNSHQALGGHISSHSKTSAGHQRSNNVRLSSESSPEQTSSKRSNNVRPSSESSPEETSLHSSNNVRSSSELSPEKTRSNNDRSSSELLPEQISPEASRNNGDVLGFDLNSMPEEDDD